MIDCASLSLRAGRKQILGNCSLRLDPGSRVILAGPSGAGKSTLLRIIAGLIPPDSGSVAIGGTVASRDGAVLLSPQDRSIGMVFQDLGLWPGLTVAGNLRLALRSRGLKRHEREARVAEALISCGLEGLGKRRPGKLSGGEQQRAALARAIVIRPRILLLDEPFASLDPALRSRFCTLLRGLAGTYGWTILTVTHEPRDAWDLAADRIDVLENGTIRESFLPGDVFNPGACGTRMQWQQLLQTAPRAEVPQSPLPEADMPRIS